MIVLFYHLWQGEGWELLFQQQMFNLYVSGLYDAADVINICVAGNQLLPFQWKKFDVKYIKDVSSELDSLKLLYDYCSLNECKVLYFHSKGLSYNGYKEREYVDAWRLYLEYYVINKWNECVHLLDEYDIVGTEWDDKSVVYVDRNKQIDADTSGFYVGNFWWANGSYVRKLDREMLERYDYIHKKRGYDISKLSNEYKQQILRFNAELFIGSGECSHYSFKMLHLVDFKFYEENCMGELLC